MESWVDEMRAGLIEKEGGKSNSDAMSRLEEWVFWVEPPSAHV